MRGRFLSYSLFLIAASSAPGALAAPPAVPKDALKALQVTRGKPCRTGVVFMDGKYLAPPYVVKRYGTAIMINDVQVTAPLIAWDEFLKTQTGVQVTRTETPAAAVPEPVAEPEVQEEESSAGDDPLADLFDDNPKPKKKSAPKKKKTVRQPPKPTVTTTYAMEGDFVMNDAAKALVDKINRYRTDVNVRLMNGGFIFFGSSYSRVSGEAREAKRLIATLPSLMRTCTSGPQMLAELRRSNFFYLTEPIAEDLVRNKYLYTQIEARAKKMDEAEKLDSLMRGSFK